MMYWPTILILLLSVVFLVRSYNNARLCLSKFKSFNFPPPTRRSFNALLKQQRCHSLIYNNMLLTRSRVPTQCIVQNSARNAERERWYYSYYIINIGYGCMDNSQQVAIQYIYYIIILCVLCNSIIKSTTTTTTTAMVAKQLYTWTIIIILLLWILSEHVRARVYFVMTLIL